MRQYQVARATAPVPLSGNWDDPAWGDAAVIRIDQFHPASSDHRPEVRARLLHADRVLHVLFDVADRYVLARHTALQAPVCQDSCVELFVQPRTDRGYFNFEFSCAGALLCYYIEDSRRTPEGFARFRPLADEHVQQVRIFHSMPRTVWPEVEAPTRWQLQAAIPLAILEACAGELGELAGQTWRANLFKCADHSSHPHWASWSPIGRELNFHQPRFFGELRFTQPIPRLPAPAGRCKVAPLPRR